MSEKEEKSYWRALGEKNQNIPGLQNDSEFPDLNIFSAIHQSLDINMDLSRRSFLKTVGFSIGAAALSGCDRAPTQKIISNGIQPEEIIPGRSAWFSSSCGGCRAGCGILVKNRDGRPLKIEGNPDHQLSRGGLCAVGQAHLLSLYDDRRLRHPIYRGQKSSWENVDQKVTEQFEHIRKKHGQIRVLSRSVSSPTRKAAIQKFLDYFGNGRHIVYDPLSYSALLDTTEKRCGQRVLPRYRFDNAELIISFDADFLGVWISPVEFANGYRSGRNLEAVPPRFSRHIQLEGKMSLTGSNADQRIVIDPFDVPLILAHLAARLSSMARVEISFGKLAPCPLSENIILNLAREIWSARQKSILICGQNNPEAQNLTAFINHLIGNERKTIDLEKPSYQYQGNDKSLHHLLQDLNQGKISALLVLDGNPLAELPSQNEWKSGLAKCELFVAISEKINETSQLAQVVCPDHHSLESWRDAMPHAGLLSLTQPILQPMWNTRSILETLTIWHGEKKSAYEIIQDYWKKTFYSKLNQLGTFADFWNQSVQNGFAQIPVQPLSVKLFDPSSIKNIGERIQGSANKKGLTLALYAKVGMLDGECSENPWLHELPDPVTKIVWDNYATLSPALAKQLDVKEGQMIQLNLEPQGPLELPAHIQPGQHDQTVSVALGYGRQGTERFSALGPDWIGAKKFTDNGGRVGVNVAPFLNFEDPVISAVSTGLTILKTDRVQTLACTQSYHTLEIPARLQSHPHETRPIIRETTYQDFQRNPGSGNEAEEKHQTLWSDPHSSAGPRWGMAIDLSACTGCSACVIACQVENNVPVVGKAEVARKHDMHWIRIDRYYSYAGESVEILHQPMLCHHCSNAPCETVCPVLATMHSKEGLNQQIYNRCVGTRYCANNCPYKVRRFNWFQYQKENQLSNMALNPDVTVRSRGVMEKCSLCVQRIQEAKFEAQRKNIPVADGTIQTACMQSCPAKAIVFGDMNDPTSQIARLKKGERYYRVLAELNIDPSIGYLTKVRHPSKSNKDPHHG